MYIGDVFDKLSVVTIPTWAKIAFNLKRDCKLSMNADVGGTL